MNLYYVEGLLHFIIEKVDKYAKEFIFGLIFVGIALALIQIRLERLAMGKRSNLFSLAKIKALYRGFTRTGSCLTRKH